jgi:hypothetical protein
LSVNRATNFGRTAFWEIRYLLECATRFVQARWQSSCRMML